MDVKNVEKRYKALQERKTIPINAAVYDVLRDITTGKGHLVEKTKLKSGNWYLRYQKRVGGKTITLAFPEVPAESVKYVADLGLLARKAFIGCLGFAFVQESHRVEVSPKYVLCLLGYEDKNVGKIRQRLDSIFVTLAYAAYRFDYDDGSYREIGHLLNKVSWFGKTKNSLMIIELNQPVVKAIFPEFFEALKLGFEAVPEVYKISPDERFINYPVARLNFTKRVEERIENLLDYLIKYQGLGKKVYPMKMVTLLTEGMGMSPERVKNLGKENCHLLLSWGLAKARLKKVIDRSAYDRLDYHVNGLNAKVKIYSSYRKRPYALREQARRKYAGKTKSKA